MHVLRLNEEFVGVVELLLWFKWELIIAFVTNAFSFKSLEINMVELIE